MARTFERPRHRSRVGGWAIAAVLAVLAILLYAIRVALLPFVFAIAVAFVVDPLIKALQRRLGCPRWPIAVGIYLCILAVLAAAAWLFGTTAVHAITDVVARAPIILKHFLAEVLGNKGVTVFGHTYTPNEIVTALGGLLAGALGITVVEHVLGMALSVILGTFLTLVLMPYFMISAPRLTAGTIWLLPPERRASVEAVLPKVVPVLRRYLVGLGIVVIYATTVAWIGFGPVFHVSHAELLAITVGLLELIPAVGPLASASIAGVVAVQQSGLFAAVMLMTFAIALRLSIDNLVGPLVLGEAARVHPVVIIISFVCGAILFGIVGLLIAVPVAVCIKTTLQHYYSEPVSGEREPSGEPRARA